ncbi:MAG: hypothetical protein AB7G12_17500 [Thermoanaerobaculia bacterium]
MSFEKGLLVVLAVAYVATIVGAAMNGSRKDGRPPRSRGREIVGAFAIPLTVLTSKHKRGLELSCFRVVAVLAAVKWYKEPVGAWQPDDWKALAVILFAFGLIDLMAAIPLRQILHAGESWAGGVAARVGDRVKELAVGVVQAAGSVPPLAPAGGPAAVVTSDVPGKPERADDSEYRGAPPGGG